MAQKPNVADWTMRVMSSILAVQVDTLEVTHDIERMLVALPFTLDHCFYYNNIERQTIA